MSQINTNENNKLDDNNPENDNRELENNNKKVENKKQEDNELGKYYSILYGKETKADLAKYLKGKSVILVGPAPYLEGKNIGALIDAHDVVVRLKSGYPVPNPLRNDLGKRVDLWYTNLKPDQNHLNAQTFEEMEKNCMRTVVFPYPIQYERVDAFRTQMLKLIKILQYNFQKGIGQIQKHFKHRNKKCPFNISYDSNSTYFQNLEKIIGTRPTTGMLAIMDLLQYDIQKLQIVGFTFRYEVMAEQERQGKDPSQFEGDAKKLGGLYSKYYKTDKSAIRSWKKTLANNTHDLKKELVFMKKLKALDERIKVDSYLMLIFGKI